MKITDVCAVEPRMGNAAVMRDITAVKPVTARVRREKLVPPGRRAMLGLPGRKAKPGPLASKVRKV
nr:hypothetical protein [Oscillibacter sp.]